MIFFLIKVLFSFLCERKQIKINSLFFSPCPFPFPCGGKISYFSPKRFYSVFCVSYNQRKKINSLFFLLFFLLSSPFSASLFPYPFHFPFTPFSFFSLFFSTNPLEQLIFLQNEKYTPLYSK